MSEIVTIGTATLYHADCRDVLPTLGKFDLLLTDPPYGINLSDNSKGGRHGRPRPSWEMSIVGDESQVVGIAALDWALRENIPAAVFASPEKPWPGEWRSLLIWDKGPAVGGGGDVKKCWKRSWELIQVARNDDLRTGRDEGVLKFHVSPSLSALHPAAKPVDLTIYLLMQLTGVGAAVLDCFMGSGTTGVACIQSGRAFTGIERERKYFDIACERISRAHAQGQLFAPEIVKPEQMVIA